MDVRPANSSWRNHALYTGKRFKKNSIQFERLDNRNIENVAAVTHSNCSNQIVISDTSSKRDVCRILSLNQTGSSKKIEIKTEFIQESTFASMSWFNKSLLCGSNDGQIYYYHCDPSAQDDPDLRETFVITKLKGIGTETGSKSLESQSLGFSTYIKSVQINPLSASNFGCLENNFYHYWEFADVVRPTISFRVSDYPVHCMAYSPHSRHYTAFGATDNMIKITDTRLMSSYASTKKTPIVWTNMGQSQSGVLGRTSYSHGVRDLAWHPYVPYWLGSANDNGDISVWDIRNPELEPVIHFPAHKGSISKINWCPMHSELLMSSSFDGEFKMWSLLNAPHYNLFQKDEIVPFLYSGFFDGDGYNNFAVSQGGDVIYSSVSQKFMASVEPSRFEKSEKSERSVERLVYNRDFINGFEKAIQMANKHSRSNQIDKAKNLLSLCFQTNVDDSLSDVLRSLSTGISNYSKTDFHSDLENYSYFIPPGYHEKYGTKLSTVLMTKVKELKVNLDIQHHIKNSSGEELMEIEKEILSTLKTDHTSIRIENIVELVEVLMNYDSTKCYQFAIDIVEIFKNKLSNIQPMIRFLLHPTIFERKPKETYSPPQPISSPVISKRTEGVRSATLSTVAASNTLNKSSDGKSPLSMSGNFTPLDIEEFRLSEYLNTTEQIIQQLTFSKEFFKILQSPQPISDGSNPELEDIIDYSSKSRPKLLLSMPINKIYLSVLKDLYIYDQFYIVLLNLMNTLSEEFEFYEHLQELYDQITPGFLEFIKNSQIRDRVKPYDTERYSVPLLTSISILYNVSYQSMPSDLHESLMQAIPVLIQEIDNSLVNTLQTPDPQQSTTGRQQASTKSKSLLEFIRSITNTTQTNSPSSIPNTPTKSRASTTSNPNRNSTSIQSPQISLELQSQINSLTLVLNKYI